MSEGNILYRQLLFVMLLLVATIFTLLAIPSTPKNPESFITWLFNYDWGLIKRGLVGHLIKTLRSSAKPISIAEMFYLTTGLSLLSWALYVALCIRAWVGNLLDGSWVLLLFIVALLTATPIGISYYVSNSHNLEVVNLLALAIFANLILFHPPRILAQVTLLVFCTASVLVHESALLSTIPVGFIIFFLHYGKTKEKSIIGFFIIISLFCTGLVVIAGINSKITAKEVIDGVARNVDGDFAAAMQPKLSDKLDVLQYSLTDNLKKGLLSFRKSRHASRAAFSLLVTGMAMLFLCVLLFRRLQLRVAVVAVIGGLLPLSLSLLADDIFRWLILAVISLSVLNLAPVSDQFKRGEADPESALTIGLGLIAVLAAVDLPYAYFMSNDGNPLLEGIQTFWATATSAF